MLYWAVDNAVVILVVAVLVSVLLFIACRNRHDVDRLGNSWDLALLVVFFIFRNWRTRHYRASILICLGLGVLPLILRLFVVTDRQQIELNSCALAQTILDKPGELPHYLAADFRFRGYGREDVVRLVRDKTQAYQIDGIALTSFSVTDGPLDDGQAKSS